MKLGRKRQIFSKHFAELVVWGNSLPRIDCTIDEVRRGKQQAEWNATHCRVPKAHRRCDRQAPAHIHRVAGGHPFRAIGIALSLHNSGLAGDLLVYQDGKLLARSEDYDFLGTHWEALTGTYEGAELQFAWGGRLGDDGGHFSLAHGDRR